jgi:putative transcriptional regulator
VTATHHLDEATIMALAAGTLGEAHGFAAATHMAFCPSFRATLHEAERLGGSLLAAVDEEAVSDQCRSATLASLEAVSAEKRKTPAKSASDVPAVLCNLIGNVPLAALRWKKMGPGIATHPIPLTPGGRTKLTLFRIEPGFRIPEHGHGGSELTVVLRGSFTDKTGRYVKGDVSDLDEDTEHQPIVDEGETCYCLFATEAPARFKSRLLRLLQPLLGF